MPLALPPVLRVVVGVAVAVVDRLCVLDELSDPDGVCDGVKDAVPVPLPVLLAVGVTERLAVDVVLPVPLSEPVELGLAPRVTDAVGEREMDRERESVGVGVSLDVGVTLDVPVPVVVALGVVLAVCEGVPEPLGVIEGDAPSETDVVGVFDVDDESDGIVDDVSDGVPEPEIVPDTVPDRVHIGSAVLVDEVVSVGVTVAQSDTVGVALALTPTEREPDAVGVIGLVGSGVDDVTWRALVGEFVTLGVVVSEFVGVVEGVPLALPPRLNVDVNVATTVEEVVGVGEPDGDRVPLIDGEGEPDGEGVQLLDTVPVGDCAADAPSVLDELDVSLPEGVAVIVVVCVVVAIKVIVVEVLEVLLALGPRVEVIEAVGEANPVPEPVCVAVAVGVTVCVGESETEQLPLPDFVGVAAGV